MAQWAVRCVVHTHLMIIWVVMGHRRGRHGLGAGGRSPSKCNHKGGACGRSSSESTGSQRAWIDVIPNAKRGVLAGGCRAAACGICSWLCLEDTCGNPHILSACSCCSETLTSVCISPKSRPGVCRRLLHRISRRNRRHHRLPVTPKIAERSKKTQCLCHAAWLCMRTGSRGPEEEGTSIPSQKDFTASVDLLLSVHLPGGTRSPQHSSVTGCLAFLQSTEPCTRTRSKIGCESSAEANSMKGTSKENTSVSPQLGDTGRSR